MHCRSGLLAEFQMNGAPINIYEPETVGCVVVDSEGHCASETSTEGLINKMLGRIGNSPIIRAFIYANRLCVVSVICEGESIIQAIIARDVVSLMEYKGLSSKSC